MLSSFTPIATVPTADLARARAFYEQTLGLSGEAQDPAEAGVLYKCGSSAFLLYPSQFAGTNQATTMAFQVDEGFDAEVAKLRDAGISFDTFEFEGATWSDGVAVMAGGKAVWFRDPDGNILNVGTMEV